jgi:hypothetical protein
MFICSVRAGTLKFFGAVLLSLALFLVILVLVDPAATATGADAVETVNYAGIKTDADRVTFLETFGWQVASPTPTEEVTFLIPKEFDRVLAGYNEIQKSQGLDLARYANKKVTRYTYELASYEGYEGKVYANLIMYKNKVIAADITSADPYGFVHGLEKQ